MRHVMRMMAVTIWCALASFPVDTARAEKRLALSVGIDVYDNLPVHEQLKKAVNDARAMGTALRELGFETTVEENLPRLAFTRAWQKFLNRLEPGDTAALFFAGHGVEIGGLNYLLPRDVPKVVLGEDRVLAGASIRFNELMDDLRDKRVRVALFIVDACRDNPFRDGSGRSVGGGRGLARIEPAEGSFVMYSAGAGEQALDRLPGADADRNSVYTRTLLPILAKPGLSLQEIAIQVRRQVVEVARTAGRKQTPAYYDQLVGEFLLKAGQAANAKPSVALAVPPQPKPELSVVAPTSKPPAVFNPSARPLTADKKEDVEAAQRYKLSADQGDATAQFRLGYFYETGRGGLPRDDREAVRLYKLSADQGNASAQANLGVSYEQGFGGLPKDHREAVRLYKLSADQGNATAQANLGMSYERGFGGLPKDDREAVRLYKLSADQGNATGQNNLGASYVLGFGGLPKDDREAARLYRLSADQGNASAQGNLGRFYETGRGGLPKDDREAARLYKLSADQGDADAANALRRLKGGR